MKLFIHSLNTDGKTSFWSSRRARVQCSHLQLAYENEEQDFGELRIYFNEDTWDVEKHGLIYTDKTFIKELRVALSKLGYAGNDVDYSEQGMQGDQYVSCDVGKKFIDSWYAKLKD